MSRVTQSLYAGLQLILPGEIAHSHRHSASALRFVLEGSGAYTSVDGERVTMKPGDFILTPFWSFHDHGNPGSEPVVWLDGLDIPIVNMFDTSFLELHEHESQPVTEGGHRNFKMKFSYEETRAALEKLPQSDSRHGRKLQYLNPSTGTSPLPTIGAYLQLLRKGFSGAPYRSTDATVFCVAEGHGTSTIGDKTFTWGPRDIFVVPSWHSVSHQANDEAVLFSFSDRPAQQSLGIWREDS